MNASILDVRIDYYRRKLIKIDCLIAELPPKNRAELESARNRYEQRLEAWQKTLGSDLASFDANVEEGFHELEAMAVRAHS